MSRFKIILTAGFAIFSMFFGSGNLVFPLMIGVETQSQYHVAAAGLLVTGVFVPFLGLLGMLYSHGNRKLFFEPLSKPVGLVVTLILLSLLGPFAVIPRCTIVAHGGFSLVFPMVTDAVFNAVFLGITVLMAWKKTRIVDVIGTYLTPFLLGGVVLIILISLFKAPMLVSSSLPSKDAFVFGVTQGYQTMDLLAAFFFSATTVVFIAKSLPEHKNTNHLESYGISASLIGIFLLASVYIGFVAIGAKFSPILQGVEPESLLVTVAVASLGVYALPVASVVIGLACLTTASILMSLFVDFVYEDIAKRKIRRTFILGGAGIFSYVLSMIGFSSLASWIGFALVFIYPALIVYTVLEIMRRKQISLFSKTMSNQFISRIGFFGTVILIIGVRFFS